ncbi:MAG: hypothetical protein H6R27_1715 [Proteobacteria bacterium]|jgi:hypothetical protein|nr:hypothetical protein [Pseudomonadota bacterium]
MFRKIIVAAALLALAGPALADETPVLDQRQERQQDRIRDGWQSGALTRQETGQLVQGQQRLRAMEHRAGSDGQFTARERARLQHQADVQSRHIYRQKHDRQGRR